MRFIRKVIRFINRLATKSYSYYISLHFQKRPKGFYCEYPVYLRGESHIEIGSDFSSHKRLRLETYSSFFSQSFSPRIVIGNNVNINYDCHIGGINRIEIGNNVLIASRVFISDHSHGSFSPEDLTKPPNKRDLISKGPVIIKDNVWIGEGVVILPNVIIGENVIVGANAVVTRDVPANSIVAGIPAKVIKKLESE